MQREPSRLNSTRTTFSSSTAAGPQIMGELAKTLVSLSGPQAVHGIIPRALVHVSAKHDGPELNGGAKAAERVVPSSSLDIDEYGISESEYGITAIVPDMHSKRLMATKVVEGGPGSGFVSLAGGFGTIEELMEMTTWNQLGIHGVEIVLLNVNGFWDGLISWLHQAIEQGFISPENGSILAVTREVSEVVLMLSQYQRSSDRMLLNWGDK
ncbi:LOG family protein [Aspergillus affinis]|uniref:LOG family protein n=1 Tax=Aspergillus affinis TaxID=1070780 RepID=UPI0022FF3ED8|nr:uncharacterized protein KD926_009562 [Aspergillus affinis]KAI9045148.1 hypothetical protein KD926_009562 [Aspergillus affinis]